VRRIAVVAGSGAEFAKAAREAGADLYVTGDVKYHQALEAAAGTMAVADVGHGSAERWILPEFRRVLSERFGNALAVRVFMEKEPLRMFRPERIPLRQGYGGQAQRRSNAGVRMKRSTKGGTQR
jgi:hypothetical protein